jgi:hypothetical protein
MTGLISRLQLYEFDAITAATIGANELSRRPYREIRIQ